ncbi:MAG: hypothetical protein IPH18_18290 [Chitinophagaceae bacterium]|nr:hypothetical protein [Chitinophagaceae bacterium]
MAKTFLKVPSSPKSSEKKMPVSKFSILTLDRSVIRFEKGSRWKDDYKNNSSRKPRITKDGQSQKVHIPKGTAHTLSFLLPYRKGLEERKIDTLFITEGF